jgi:ENTH domain
VQSERLREKSDLKRSRFSRTRATQRLLLVSADMDRAVLLRATSRDASPTPGYLYDEIAKMTHADFAGCRALLTFLKERIKRDDPYTKHKCLLVIKHVCMKGRPDFKKDMQRSVDDVKACLAYTGPPDPLRGDELYKRVREAAKETLECIYADEHNNSVIGGVYSNTSSSASQYGRIEGIGGAANGYDAAQHSGMQRSLSDYGGSSAGYSGHSAATASSGRRSSSSMQGIGNYDPNTDKTWLERASDTVLSTAVKAAGAVDSKVKSIRQQQLQGSHYSTNSSSNSAMSFSNSAYPPGGYSHSSSPPIAHTYSSSNSSSYSAQQPNAVYSNSISTAYNNGQTASSGSTGGGDSSGTYELIEVRKLCAPGGTRSSPTVQELDAFVAKAASLNVDRLASAVLDTLLTTDDWRVQSKALAIISALITSR